MTSIHQGGLTLETSHREGDRVHVLVRASIRCKQLDIEDLAWEKGRIPSDLCVLVVNRRVTGLSLRGKNSGHMRKEPAPDTVGRRAGDKRANVADPALVEFWTLRGPLDWGARYTVLSVLQDYLHK